MIDRAAFWTLVLFIASRNVAEAFVVRKRSLVRDVPGKDAGCFLLLVIPYVTVVILSLMGRWNDDAGIDPLLFSGLVVSSSGYLGRIVSIRALGVGYSYSLHPISDQLVIIGPYAVVRHPIYSSYMIEIAGIFLIYPTILSAVAVALSIVICILRVRSEERYLIDRFGELYRERLKKTWTFFPYVY